SALITQLLNAVFQIIVVRKTFNWNIDWRLILSLVLFTVLTFTSGWFLSNLENRLIGIAAMTGISIILAFATRLISIKGIFAILKEKDA
ncbi:MAG: hypothetical protein AB7G44_15570, partial [Bacteroidia bacterium]